ncbi:uncharacterized protein PAC_03413 [Phialocephala subalpina]|uniref:Tat pathway signal sequence n=1 Tax=Phialocephala subalpina TaxID=576137 RepID=A0A1L7WL98_9HELO|nr:uncharacterized protein PAC_03413 [Phialocephala subalpina]
MEHEKSHRTALHSSAPRLGEISSAKTFEIAEGMAHDQGHCLRGKSATLAGKAAVALRPTFSVVVRLKRSRFCSRLTIHQQAPTDFISAPDIHTKRNISTTITISTRAMVYSNSMNTGVPKLYAGYPSKEIDDAGSDLLTASWDLKALDGDKVYMEVSVFHNLHCLDLARRALDPDHYNANTDFTSQLDPQWKRVHIYHCIDQLRQTIQCQSDLTPVPLFSVEGPQKKSFATHSVAHTCRDFDAVKKWGAERNKEKVPFNWNAWTG